MSTLADRFSSGLELLEKSVHRLSDGSPRSRAVIVVLAVVILFARMPGTFIHPAFWAEDSILFEAAYNRGLASLTEPLGGTYFNLYGSLVANIAIRFPPLWWPWISTYGAHAAALLVVFLVTSPRLEIPYKAIAALAIVATPIQDSTLGGLANAQWILPVGLFALLFSRASRSQFLLLLEGAFIAIVGLDGPLGCFLLPLFLWRAWNSEGIERRRLLILTTILLIAAIIQIATIAQNLQVFNLAQPMPYDHIVWVTMPLRWLDALRFAGLFGEYIFGGAIVILGVAGLIWFSFKTPYRDQKLSMILFAGLILYSGMFKFRHFLYLHDNDRYVYVGSVFFFWFLCVWAATIQKESRVLIVAIAATLLVTSTARRVNEWRPTASVTWASMASQIGSGPIVIPVAPADIWALHLNR